MRIISLIVILCCIFASTIKQGKSVDNVPELEQSTLDSSLTDLSYSDQIQSEQKTESNKQQPIRKYTYSLLPLISEILVILFSLLIVILICLLCWRQLLIRRRNNNENNIQTKPQVIPQKFIIIPNEQANTYNQFLEWQKEQE